MLARKVSHPNLCPIYDIARSSDPPPPFLFLTMKLLQGETLSARLQASEPIPRAEKISIFRQMMAGISALHDAGVIHRDIKPKNVMLEYSGTEVCLSIMDFGLARLHEPETTSATRSLVAGTPGYIPHEILDRQPPSQAGDLFALGVLLYQVATRKLPQFGPLTNNLEPSVALDSADVPPFFIKAVKGLLSSDPAQRCESAKIARLAFESQSSIDVLSSVRHTKVLAVTAGLLIGLVSLLLVPAVGERTRGILFASREKHIVVLPFELTGHDLETQALGDGLMDSLAGKLSELDVVNQSLWVVPAKEVRARKVGDARSALREFGATLVVEGRFERDPAATHLKLTLTDPKKVREIGFVDVQNSTGDLGELQDEAVTRLGRLMNISIKETVSAREQKPLSHSAYEDYLLALGYAQRFDRPGNLDRAVAALQVALKTDPGFTIGSARLAQVFVMKYRIDKNSAWLDQAKVHADQALRSNTNLPLAHVALGQVEELTGHHDLAAQEFQRAITLDPRDPEALTGLATSDRNLGRYTAAEAIYIKAENLRPDDWNGYNTLGQFYQRIGRPRDAVEQFRRAIALVPDNASVYANLGSAYLDIGDPRSMYLAEQAFTKSISMNPTYAAYTDLGILYATENRYQNSIAAILEALKLNAQDYRVWNNLVEGYEWIGDEQNATQARQQARRLLVEAIRLNPQSADAEATLAVLLAKDGLREESLKKIQTALALEPANQYVLADVADAYELLGERHLAVRWLQQALLAGMPAANLKTDPYLRKLILDPHFRLPKTAPGV
ncbi:MAG: serine/threonine-protein kinase [Acidobacteriaceae bacterium]